jgi:hypothetical protein
VAVPPAATVVGVAIPLTLKPDPVTARSAIVSAAVPVLVTVIACDFVWPSTMLPKLKVAGERLNPGAAAVPVTGIVSGEFPALLTIEIDPVMLPDADGEKAAPSVTLSDGVRVAGVVIPVSVRPVPAALTLVMLTDAVPVFVITTCLVLVVPVPIVPKLRLAGLALNCPVAVEVPVPLRATVTFGVTGSLLVMARLPVALPATAGVKVTAI